MNASREVPFCDLERRAESLAIVRPLVGERPPRNYEGARIIIPRSVGEIVNAPHQKWIVREVVPAQALAVVYGEPGSGKTFLVADLAIAIARGVPWMGHRTRKGAVLYVVAEGSLRGRLDAYLAHHELKPEDLELLRVVPHSINLRDENADTSHLIEATHELAEQIGNVTLVIIDTLSRTLAAGNENSPEDMGAMIRSAGQITDATGATVLYIHHSGKDQSKGSRGHSSLKGAADLELEVTGTEGTRVATITKQKDAINGERFAFDLISVDLGPDPDPYAEPGERLSSCIVQPATSIPKAPRKAVRRDVALDALREAIEEYGERMGGTSTIPAGVTAVRLEQWRTRWALRTGIENAESGRVNFIKDKSALLKSGQVGISAPFCWIN